MRYVTLFLVLASLTVACGDDDRPRSFRGIVEKEVVGNEVDGIQVYVVSAEDPDGVAQECVDFYLEDYRSASCYVFESQAAFEAAGTSDEYGKAMENVCWKSFRSVSPTAQNGSDDNPRFKPKLCS